MFLTFLISTYRRRLTQDSWCRLPSNPAASSAVIGQTPQSAAELNFRDIFSVMAISTLLEYEENVVDDVSISGSNCLHKRVVYWPAPIHTMAFTVRTKIWPFEIAGVV